MGGETSLWQWLIGGLAAAALGGFWRTWDRIGKADERIDALRDDVDRRTTESRKMAAEADTLLHGRVNDLVRSTATKEDLGAVEERIERALEGHERRQAERHAEVLKRLDARG